MQDVRIFSRWGRAEVRGRGNFELFARSGNVDNPDRNWSPWSKIDLNKDARLEIPSARFVQWRAVLKPGTPPARIDEVAINYLPKNVAPVVDDVYVQVGAKFPSATRTSTQEPITVGPVFSQPTVPRIETAPTAQRDRAYVGVRWVAHDENDDDLVYSLYYRGEKEQEWKLLKSGLTEKYYSFESGLLPDGGYMIKVVASDAPAHTPEDALSAEKQSLDGLTAKVDGPQLHVTFHALDDFSPIKRAEYSVDAGEWQFVAPVGQLSDSKSENYDFNVLLPETLAPAEEQPADQKRGRKAKNASPPEHVVVVRIYDRFDNVAVAKYVAK